MPPPILVTTTHATPIPLMGSETTIFQVRRSIVLLIIPLLFVTLIGLALYLTVSSLGGVLPASFITFLHIGIIVAVAFIDLIIFVDWLTTLYTLTNYRVQFRFGIVGQQTKTIALQQVTNTKVEIGIIGRIFGYGSVVIEAANINSTITFRGIAGADGRKQQIDDATLAIGP